MKSLFQTLTVLASVVAAPAFAAEAEVVEIPLAQVFVPATGFDDNDSVEIFLDGTLPNSCYTLEKHKLVSDLPRRHFAIQQFAIRNRDGICDGTSPLPAGFSSPVPFTVPVTLGRLERGLYGVSFRQSLTGPSSLRRFRVDAAPVATADSRFYAMTRNVVVADVLRVGQPLKIEISGVLNNSCYELEDKVDVEIVDDIVVLMPTVKMQEKGGACLEVIRPFAKSVLVRALPAKRYLVHVRSMHGRSVNASFTVTR